MSNVKRLAVLSFLIAPFYEACVTTVVVKDSKISAHTQAVINNVERYYLPQPEEEAIRPKIRKAACNNKKTYKPKPKRKRKTTYKKRPKRRKKATYKKRPKKRTYRPKRTTIKAKNRHRIPNNKKIKKRRKKDKK